MSKYILERYVMTVKGVISLEPETYDDPKDIPLAMTAERNKYNMFRLKVAHSVDWTKMIKEGQMDDAVGCIQIFIKRRWKICLPDYFYIVSTLSEWAEPDQILMTEAEVNCEGFPLSAVSMVVDELDDWARKNPTRAIRVTFSPWSTYLAQPSSERIVELLDIEPSEQSED